MNYQTYEPSEILSPFVKCYWTLDSPGAVNVQKQTIVPDGCIEMIFHYGDLYKQYLENEKYIIQPRSFIFGQLTQPLEIEPTGLTGIFSVRFHPEGFMPFSTLALKKVENKALSLEKLFGQEGLEIEQTILKSSSTLERIKSIEHFLIQRISSKKNIDYLVASIVETIMTANGQMSIAELSKSNGINKRQLERKFYATIGMSPKQLSKTIRLQTVLKILFNKQFKSFTDLAYEGNYYDQAHFIKDFKALTGFTPKAFYKDNLKLSALFYNEI